MINYYTTKLSLALRMSSNVKTFFRLIINSKKYSYNYKRGSLQKKSDEFERYDFNMNKRSFKVLMRTYRGDIDIFYEVFWKEVYKIPVEFQSTFNNIVDLGAHIGLTSFYYSFLYPTAKIYSVEASLKNFQLLEQNLKNNENVNVIHAAIYSFDGEVKFDNSSLSYNNKIGTSGDLIPSLSVKTLMDKYNIDKIDLLKIDIEGAERFLLGQNNEWLEKVDNIIIEVHEPYTISNLVEDIKLYGFKVYYPETTDNMKNVFATKLELN